MSFTAWRLEIQDEQRQADAWYADTPTRPLVHYDNDRGLIFELERRRGPVSPPSSELEARTQPAKHPIRGPFIASGVRCFARSE